MNPGVPRAAQPPAGRLWARYGLDPSLGAFVDGVRVEWAAGRWTRVERSPRPPADYRPDECHPEGLLTPGLLNAHAHLDYSFLLGRLPSGQGFAPWLRGMIAARFSMNPGGEADRAAACREALAASLADGVTAVWDIDSLGLGRAALAEAALEAISFAELTAFRVDRWPAEWSAWLAAHADLGSASFPPSHGLSIHTLYTVCPPAVALASGWAAGRGLPLAVHLAESPEEAEMLRDGRGALYDLFAGIGLDPACAFATGPGASGPIQRAAQAGLLAPSTLAIHCNLPENGDIERLARSRAAVVFCPRSHRFFGYPDYPLAGYRRAGVRLALGTDSLASNWTLSMRDEAREVAARFPETPPLDILALATGSALGDAPLFGGRGRLLPGASAQWALWRAPVWPSAASPDSLFSAWLAPQTLCASSSAIAPANPPSPFGD